MRSTKNTKTFFENFFDFLFGKSPDIFDDKGNVSHDLPRETWKAWDKRYHDEEHNWHHHEGVMWQPEDEERTHQINLSSSKMNKRK